MKLGVHIQSAVACGITSKGPCCSSKTPGIQQALSNAYLKSQGLYSLRDGLSFIILNETPCADPHAGCCGGWRLDTSGYPIIQFALIWFLHMETWSTSHFRFF